MRIVRTKVDGDKATTTVVFRRSGDQVRQRVLLEKDGGDWKIAGGTG